MNVKISFVLDLEFAVSLNLLKLSHMLPCSLRCTSCTLFRIAWPGSLTVCRAPARGMQSITGSQPDSVELAVVTIARSASAINC